MSEKKREAVKKNHSNYERSDAKIRAITWSGISLLALIFLIFVVIFGVFHLLKEKRQKSLPVPSPLAGAKQQKVIESQLLVQPAMELVKFRALQDSLKSHYGWVVKEAGVVRIPVDRAMELMLQRGLPVRQNLSVQPHGEERIK
ncbi:MAG: hypothetical protein ACE5HS_12875 [bacterium]